MVQPIFNGIGGSGSGGVLQPSVLIATATEDLVPVGYPATTILTVVAPSIGLFLTHISCSGAYAATFQYFKNGLLEDTKRSGAVPGSNADFWFPFPLQLDPGDVLDVKVAHGNSVVPLPSFSSTVYGLA